MWILAHVPGGRKPWRLSLRRRSDLGGIEALTGFATTERAICVNRCPSLLRQRLRRAQLWLHFPGADV